MAGRGQYTAADKAKVLVALRANDGNIGRTARDTGVPESTVRLWRDDWDANGVPDAVEQETDLALDHFVEDAVRVRNLALRKMEDLIPKATDASKLVAVVGMLDDKITRAKGLPTQRTEHSAALPAPEQVGQLVGGWIRQALLDANAREQDIIETDAVEVEQPIGTLPSPGSIDE